MKVLLLAGGDSTEREVSLNSGRAVYDALRELGHTVAAIDPATGTSLLDRSGDYLSMSAVQSISFEKAAGQLTGLYQNQILTERHEKMDIVFNALHGGAGENGQLQCLLDLAGMKYTGAGMTASAVAMDKALTKRLMVGRGIATPKWNLFKIDNDQQIGSVAEAVAERFEAPVIVKPNEGGSTVGLTKVSHFSELADALAKAARLGRNVLVEEFIDGREITAAIFDGTAYPLVEIKPLGGLYDYEAKYTKGKSEYFCPAPIPQKLAQEITRTAQHAYELVDAEGLVRIDFMLAANDDFYCLEINTVPGMTALSLAPMAAKAIGIDFKTLIQNILDAGMRRPNRQ